MPGRPRLPAFARQLRRSGNGSTPISEGTSDRAVLRRDTRYRRALALSDVGAAALAVCVSLYVLGDDKPTVALLLAAPAAVLVSKLLGLYDRDEDLLSKSTLDEVPTLFYLATLYTLLLWLGSGVLFEGSLGRDQVLGLWGLLFLATASARALARTLVTRLTAPERCLVLGGAEAEERIRGKLAASHKLNAVVVGRVPLEGDRAVVGEPPVLGSMEALEAVLADSNVQRVIIAPTTANPDRMLEGIRLAKSLGVRVSVLPRLLEVIGSSVRFDDVHGMTLLGVPAAGLTDSSRMLKRSFDVLAASSGMVLLAPLAVTIAIAIKLSSPGPVLYRQTRVGRDGREFQMLKFRSMVADADARKPELRARNEAGHGLFKIAGDPRVTRVGRVLRRLSLDELPQLLNVFNGEMSLVGPRPLVPEDDRHVTEDWQRKRLHMPPGITGVWQVLGSSRVPLHEMVSIDYLYYATWSPWLDLKILLRTVPHMVARRGL